MREQKEAGDEADNLSQAKISCVFIELLDVLLLVKVLTPKTDRQPKAKDKTMLSTYSTMLAVSGFYIYRNRRLVGWKRKEEKPDNTRNHAINSCRKGPTNSQRKEGQPNFKYPSLKGKNRSAQCVSHVLGLMFTSKTWILCRKLSLLVFFLFFVGLRDWSCQLDLVYTLLYFYFSWLCVEKCSHQIILAASITHSQQ